MKRAWQQHRASRGLSPSPTPTPERAKHKALMSEIVNVISCEKEQPKLDLTLKLGLGRLEQQQS